MRILIYILPILIITACKEKVELDNNSNCDPKSLGHLSLTMDDGRFVAGDTIVINGNFQTPIEAQLQFLITYINKTTSSIPAAERIFLSAIL